MPRQGRHEEPGAIHHVVVQGLDRRAIVVDDRDRNRFLSRLEEAVQRFGWERLADSLLDTHGHFLIRTPIPNLGVGTGWLLGGYTRSFRVRHGGTGPLFWPRFWSRRIHDEAQLLRAALYVDLNPVSAGLAPHPARYPWCSYGRERPWLVGVLGEDVATAARAYAAIVDEACLRLRSRMLPDVVAETVGGVAATRGGR